MKYGPEIKQWIAENVVGRTAAELAEMANEKWGTDFTPKSMKSFKTRFHLKSGTKKGYEKGRPTALYPKEVKDYIAANCYGISVNAMCDKLEDVFGIRYKYDQLRRYYNMNGLKTGRDCRFKPGGISFTKGLTLDQFLTPEQIEHMTATQFKKGHKPKNYHPVGTVVLGTQGYYLKKVGDPNEWKLLHRLMWEEAYGPVPEEMCILFKDGDSTNCTLENMTLITRRELALINRKGLVKSDPELTEVGINIARIKIACTDAKRARKL